MRKEILFVSAVVLIFVAIFYTLVLRAPQSDSPSPATESPSNEEVDSSDAAETKEVEEPTTPTTSNEPAAVETEMESEAEADSGPTAEEVLAGFDDSDSESYDDSDLEQSFDDSEVSNLNSSYEI